jgi:hypothetical protein
MLAAPVRIAYIAVVASLVCGIPRSSFAQHSSGPAVAPVPHEASQLDFLIGKWDLVVQPVSTSLAARIHGLPSLAGTWSAWRVFDGRGLEDEVRITDASGNPRALSHTVRMFDPKSAHWIATALDVFAASFITLELEWKDNALTSTSHGTDANGAAYVGRSRIYEITPTTFLVQQERSMDNGKTWQETLHMQAKRVSAIAPR